MKTKKLLFAAAALTVLTACSSDESPIENTENRVPVTLAYTTIDAVETRAAQNLNEGTFATGEAVTVRISNTGADAWTDYTFTTAAEGTMTAPNPAPYYPAGSQNIDIAAYYPVTAGSTFTVADDQTADASYKASDLMFASVTNQAKQADAVNLAFTHKMAKLAVNITAGQGVTSITSVSILNVKPTVSFNQATGAVGEATGTATTITISNNGAAVIPAQTIDGGLLSIVTDKGTATYSVASKEFAAGQKYTLNITVNLRAVGTTTAIMGWTSEGTVTVNPTTTIVQKTPVGLTAVDLGLSVKWANMNVGAEAVTGYGTYFAWGETAGITVSGASATVVGSPAKTTYDWTNYDLGTSSSNLFMYNSTDGLETLKMSDDAAYVNWGGTWRMPTEAEWEELKNTDNCTWTWQSNYNSSGVAGYLVTSKKSGYTSNSIFLPAAGRRGDSSFSRQGSGGYYWSSSLLSSNPGGAWYLYFNSSNAGMSSDYRFNGYTVRAVTE
ncbi:MAG: fimbrillin family protein [Eggerthellaceae bacterium]|nr:fimbrillin family protein [Eggerthellaceae bacterium]